MGGRERDTRSEWSEGRTKELHTRRVGGILRKGGRVAHQLRKSSDFRVEFLVKKSSVGSKRSGDRVIGQNKRNVGNYNGF